jgi:hypothetical protein
MVRPTTFIHMSDRSQPFGNRIACHVKLHILQTPCRDYYSPGNVGEKGDPTLRAVLSPGRSTDWAEAEFIEGNGNIQGRLPCIARLNHSDYKPIYAARHHILPRTGATRFPHPDSEGYPPCGPIDRGWDQSLDTSRQGYPRYFRRVPLSRDESADLDGVTGLLPGVPRIVINRDRIRGMDDAVSSGLCRVLPLLVRN